LELSQVVANCATGYAFSQSVEQFRNAGSHDLTSMGSLLTMLSWMDSILTTLRMIPGQSAMMERLLSEFG
jgi:hypothetical protein